MPSTLIASPARTAQPSTRQQFLGIRCELHLPTCDLAGARALLDIHENEIKALIDTSALIAWDISRSFGSATKSDDDRTRRELRFLIRALRDYAEAKPINRDTDWITRLLYGKEKPFILGKDFHAAWNCDSGHMINLIRDGTLATVPGTEYGPGRGFTPCITWSSAIAFLEKRRLS